MDEPSLFDIERESLFDLKRVASGMGWEQISDDTERAIRSKTPRCPECGRRVEYCCIICGVSVELED